jgi:hypothetical protein
MMLALRSKTRQAASHHPVPKLERLIRSPLGALTQAPFVDPMALFALRRLFFPLSRMWAAAGQADQSVADFVQFSGLSAVHGKREKLVAKLLARSGEIRREAAKTETEWRNGLFGATQKSSSDLAALEHARLEAAHRATLDRLSYYPLLWNGKAHKLRWEIPTQGEVEDAYGAYLNQPEAAYDLPEVLPDVECSQAIDGRMGKIYWLRFASPSSRMGDVAYAKVMEPAADNPPTIIIGNGVCMEPENARDLVDAAIVMCRLGFRVVEITTPWHARRCRLGDYGGERFFATAPMGQIDLFTAQAKETGVLIDWCRRNFSGPVVLAGISLGSFVAQLVAAHSRHWPQSARPDVLLLITHTGRMEEVVFESGLVEGIGIPAALQKAGWSQQQMLRWAPLMDPPGAPALPADRIVSVLGMSDRVTPVGGGLDLVKRWGVPTQNAFVDRQGHFGAAVKLIRDDSPLRRVQEIVREL